MPRRDRPRDLRAVVVARHLVAVAGRPDDVRIGRIGNGEARLAAAEAVIPLVARSVVAGAGAFGRDRRPAHRAVVLHVRVDVVRHLVVDGDVIHLADRQLHALRAAAVLRGQRDAGVVRDREAIGVLRIPPDVVVVAAPVDAAERLAAVDRLEERAVGDRGSRPRSPARRRGGCSSRRGRSARATSSRRARSRRRRRSARPSPDPWSESARRRDSNRSARRRRRSCRAATCGSPAASIFVHFAAAVARDVDAAARAAAEHRPRVHLDLPGAGDQIVRGFFASIDSPEQPVFSSTNSTRSQCWPPSVVRKTPRSCCGAVMRPIAHAKTMSGFVGWTRMRPMRPVSSRPMCVQVLPASIDL